MSAFVAGKALLVVTRDSSYCNGWGVRAITQHLTYSSDNRCAAMYWASEELELLEWDAERLPGCTRRMKEGDTMRIAVTFSVDASVYWDGEGDTELSITKARMLRHQRRGSK